MSTLPASFTERPCAAPGLTSYRCSSRYGWIMIGAKDDREALQQARRSAATAKRQDLQVWNGERYVPVGKRAGERSRIPGRPGAKRARRR